MDLKKLNRIFDASSKSYSELAVDNNGDSLLKKALRDHSMKEISKDSPFTIISNGKEAFLYAFEDDYWSNDSDKVSSRFQ